MPPNQFRSGISYRQREHRAVATSLEEITSSTQIYTNVSILKLKEIHAATHPARLERKKPRGGFEPSIRSHASLLRVRVVFEGDDPIEVDRRVWQLFSKMSVRKAIEQVIAPLFKQGIDTFKIRRKGKETLKVAEDEAKYFLAPTEHEGETISSTETRVVIVAPSFQEGNKWRVSDGSRNIFVSIEDPNFVGAVQSGREAFRKGDILRVQLQTRQWLEGTELKAEHAIVKVLQH
jgi:hypothetical protein